MLGETNPLDSLPGTIRGDLCVEIGRWGWFVKQRFDWGWFAHSNRFGFKYFSAPHCAGLVYWNLWNAEVWLLVCANRTFLRLIALVWLYCNLCQSVKHSKIFDSKTIMRLTAVLSGTSSMAATLWKAPRRKSICGLSQRRWCATRAVPTVGSTSSRRPLYPQDPAWRPDCAWGFLPSFFLLIMISWWSIKHRNQSYALYNFTDAENPTH